MDEEQSELTCDEVDELWPDHLFDHCPDCGELPDRKGRFHGREVVH